MLYNCPQNFVVSMVFPGLSKILQNEDNTSGNQSYDDINNVGSKSRYKSKYMSHHWYWSWTLQLSRTLQTYSVASGTFLNKLYYYQ